MLTVRGGLAVGLTVLLGILAALEVAVGLSGPAWVVGLTCGAVAIGASIRGMAQCCHAVGPPDLVTLTRVALACGVAALVAEAFVHQAAVRALVGASVAALVLDAVDGWVARRTRTSTFGARFDGEVDAFLMLVLSVYVADTVGGWVLAIGAARYAFAVAGWGLPWLRAQLPPRYWRKVVTATQGIVLTVAAADVVPDAPMHVALVGALALLGESFGRDVLWLWRHRRGEQGGGRREGADAAAAAVDDAAREVRTMQP